MSRTLKSVVAVALFLGGFAVLLGLVIVAGLGVPLLLYAGVVAGIAMIVAGLFIGGGEPGE